MVTIFTDGACIGNPGAGGWGAILKYEQKTKELSGGEKLTTNNRMEITAVIKALNALKYATEVEVFSDSQYVVNTINKQYKIKMNGDLWSQLFDAINRHNKVTFKWIKGHNGHPENERCDYLATREAQYIAK